MEHGYFDTLQGNVAPSARLSYSLLAGNKHMYLFFQRNLYICMCFTPVGVGNRLDYLRAHVDPIRKHFDPIASIVDSDIIVAHGLAVPDLMRLKNHLADLNQCGLILVDRDVNKFRFLRFEETVLGVYPNFKEAAEDLGLTIGFDFQLKDIPKKEDFEALSKWVTLKSVERYQAENLAKSTTLLLENSRLLRVLGSKAIKVIRDLMWESNAFEPLHAISVLAKVTLENKDISGMIKDLRNIGADLRYITGSTNRILFRRKPNITIMDCAKFLFSEGNYIEKELSDTANILRKPVEKLSSHFRGYLIVGEDYVNNLFESGSQ